MKLHHLLSILIYYSRATSIRIDDTLSINNVFKAWTSEFTEVSTVSLVLVDVNPTQVTSLKSSEMKNIQSYKLPPLEIIRGSQNIIFGIGYINQPVG